jgi:WD40 repeat protein
MSNSDDETMEVEDQVGALIRAPEEDDDELFIGEDEGEEVEVDDTLPVEDDDDDIDDMDDLPPAQSADGMMSDEPIDDNSFHTLSTHRGPVYAIAVTPSPTSTPQALSYYVATGSGDDTAQLSTVNVSGGAAGSSTFQPLPGHAESVSTAKFSSDKSYLATADYSGIISLWDRNPATATDPSAPPLKLDRTLPSGPSDCEWLTWHPKGNVFAVGSTDGTVWMYLAKTGAVMQVFAGHDPASSDGDGGGGVSCGQFTLDGTRLLTTGGSESDSTLRIWNPKTGLGKHVFRHDEKGGAMFPRGGLNTLALGGGTDGELVAVGGGGGEVGVVHLGSKKVLGRPLLHANVEMVTDGEASVEVVKWSPMNPNYLATGGVDGRVIMWEIGAANSGSSAGVERSVLGHPGGVTALEFHNTDKLDVGAMSLFHGIYTCCSDGILRLWDVRSKSIILSLTGHRDMILCVEVIKVDEGDVVVTGGDDHTVKVWTISNQQMLAPPLPAVAAEGGA